MVTNITSLTGNGLKDWLVQRVTAVYFAAYSIFMMVYFAMHPKLSFMEWQELFACKAFQIATVLAVLTLTLHAWVGLWTVTTDYIKCSMIRLSTQLLILLWLVSQFVWVIMIVWGR